MPILEKYQSLPGLDTWSPDVFETPDLEESVAGVETPDTPSETTNDELDYSSISADVARERFLNKTLNPGGPVEDPMSESTTMKIARLNKEMDDLADSITTEEHTKKDPDEPGNVANEVTELANKMRAILTSRQQNSSALGVLKYLGTKNEFLATAGGLTDSQVRTPSAPGVNPSTLNDGQNSKFIDLDNRVARLEKALGNPSSVAFHGAFHATIFEQPVIPTLLSLSQKINSLISAPEKFDATLTRVRELVAEAEKISSASPGKHSSSGQRVPITGEDEDASRADKIDALYSSLASVEKLMQVVPGLVERLRSLRFLHSEAGETIGNISEIREKVNGTEAQISTWRGALENAEKRLDEIEEREKANLVTADEWVKDLERRVNYALEKSM
ncbi:Dynamitin-domain-containing protein [Lipomyces orientalis]|uniref:Dynamitin-domain-containing protein n=1 Tax=Lipomyces orientalis TaxID=1233043 RepID=A0ACC3TDW7_9ASCO